jgi:hypothetical protein
MNLLFNDDGSKRDYTLKQNGTYRVSNLNEPCGEYLTTTSAMKEIEKDVIIHIIEFGVNEFHLDMVKALVPSTGMILDCISLSRLSLFTPEIEQLDEEEEEEEEER